MSATPVVIEIANQVNALVFLPRGHRLISLSETTLRVALGKLNIDIEYDAGPDLYNVSVHKIGRDLDVKTETHEGIFCDQLADFFPARLRRAA